MNIDSSLIVYDEKIKQNEDLLSEFKSELKELENKYKLVKMDEQKSKGNVDLLIKVMQKKRKIKEGLEHMHECVKDIQKHKEKLENTKNYKMKKAKMFENLKIDVSKIIIRRSPVREIKNKYHDREFDQDRILKIKQGIVLGSNERNKQNQALNYGIYEQKYHIRNILTMQREKSIENDVKRKQAVDRQKKIVEKIEDHKMRNKILKKHGISSRAANNLYPDLLTDTSLKPFYQLRRLLNKEKQDESIIERQCTYYLI